jgi:hypothetical protein
MYTTIEPRLIALLNTDVTLEPYSTPTSRSLELPPLHDPNILKASGCPLLLEPDANTRSSALISSPDEDENKTHERKKRLVDRILGNSSPQSLRKILDDDNADIAASASKKRNIVESSKDDFVQLPQPPKKQKAAKQVVPPIIIGLFEPPPQTALFPPIASSSFHDSHGRNSLNTIPPNPKVKEVDEPRHDDPPAPLEEENAASTKPTKKRTKPRKKWTEEETNNLLLGVSKHGLGNWADILEDPCFSFNDRSGVDLKDRFRTCCPAELREQGSKCQSDARRAEEGAGKIGNPGRAKSSLMTENILIDDKINANSTAGDVSSKTPKSRGHRKKLEDLAQLGIEGPFPKSQRRERHPFSEQDDYEILMGFNIYGTSWTRIHKDPRFHLQSRRPTDLRDRFRNKYPEKWEATSEGSKSELRENNNSNPSQPSSTLHSSSSRDGLRIQQIISSESEVEESTSKGRPAQSQLANYNFGTFPEQSDGLFNWGHGHMTAPFSGTIGEMDISRLLLDEPWIESTVKEKPSFTDINSIITSNSDSPPLVPSFLNMLVADEPISIPSSDTSFG